MRKAFVGLPDGSQMHYRISGAGPAMIMLHPSPQSSATLVPAIEAFSSISNCIAFDTPGYGLSDPLPSVAGGAAPKLADYVDRFAEALDALKIEQFCVYGSATGAQIAIEFGKRFPDRVKFVMLESNGEFPDDMCEEFIASGYFADVAPRRDGGHLLTYWDMCKHLFYAFPWYSDDDQHRLPFDTPPAEVIHQTFLRYLQAGDDYADAYRPALFAERLEHFEGMNTPAVMTRWASSPVLPLADALIERGLPPNVRVLEADHGLEARYEVQLEALGDEIARQGLEPVANVAPPSVSAGSDCRTYLESNAGQLHTIVRNRGGADPLVLLHGAGSSASALLEKCQSQFGDREIWALDLPFHGASPDLPDPVNDRLEAMVEAARSALQNSGLENAELAGEGLGAAIALKLRAQDEAASVTVLDPIPYSQDELRSARDGGLADLAPRADGSHLVSAWATARGNAIFWPHWDHRAQAQRKAHLETSPQTLHDRASDLLRTGKHWRELMLLEISIDWHKALAGKDARILKTGTHPCPDRLADLPN